MEQAFQFQKYFVEQMQSHLDVEQVQRVGIWVYEHLKTHEADVLKDEFEHSERIQSIIDQLKAGGPLQYILGRWPFMGMELKVDHRALIPRPETEFIVDAVIRDYENLDKPKVVYDLCTGSGCMALALKKYFPEAKVSGTDLSEEALSLANENAVEQQLELEWLLHDIHKEPLNESFDLLVCNPPYIGQDERSLMDEKVLHYEPEMALFPEGTDRLIFYRQLCRLIKAHGQMGAKAYLEINQFAAEETKQLFQEAGFQQLSLHKDLDQHWRYIKVTV